MNSSNVVQPKSVPSTLDNTHLDPAQAATLVVTAAQQVMKSGEFVHMSEYSFKSYLWCNHQTMTPSVEQISSYDQRLYKNSILASQTQYPTRVITDAR